MSSGPSLFKRWGLQLGVSAGPLSRKQRLTSQGKREAAGLSKGELKRRDSLDCWQHFEWKQEELSAPLSSQTDWEDCSCMQGLRGQPKGTQPPPPHLTLQLLPAEDLKFQRSPCKLSPTSSSSSSGGVGGC